MTSATGVILLWLPHVNMSFVSRLSNGLGNTSLVCSRVSISETTLQ